MYISITGNKGNQDVYNQKDAEGFINLFGLPIHVKAKLDQKRGK